MLQLDAGLSLSTPLGLAGKGLGWVHKAVPVLNGDGAGAGAWGSIGGQGGACRQHLDGQVPAECVNGHLLWPHPGHGLGLLHGRQKHQARFSGCYKLKV